MKVLLIGIILTSFYTLGFAIRCYNCLHSTVPEDNQVGIPNDPTCKNADPKHVVEVVDCDFKGALKNYELMQKNHPNLKLNFTIPTDVKQARISCADIVAVSGSLDFTIRGCVINEANGCESDSDGNARARRCVCDTDACNKNTSALASNIPILSLATVLTAAVAIFISHH